MRHPRRLVLATVLALAALSLHAGAGPASAKEGLMAAFDAPIAFDTPPGTELLVGVTVTVLGEDGEHPVFGSPIVLILTGRDGTETEARGVEDATGHYVMRITVPPGGARDARVVMRGTGGDGPADIELIVTNDPFTFGGVSPRTAQVAPAPSPAPTPLTQEPAAPAAGAPAEPALAASGEPAGAPGGSAAATSPATGTWWPPALALVALGVAVVVAIRLRSGRRPAQGT
jgi:hypothetical protein